MQSIDIRTTQNVVIDYELAPLRDRFVGFFIDILLVFISCYLIVLLLSALILDGNELLFSLLKFLPLLGFLLYTLGMEIFNNGRSLGKMAMGTKVLKLDGQEPRLSDFLVRAIFHLIDTYLCAGVLAAIFIATSKNGQRLGDRAANTVVVKLNTRTAFNLDDILNISTVDNYEPTFTEIRNVSEADMLVIKNALFRYRNDPNETNGAVIKQLVDKMRSVLGILESPQNNVEFLKTLIKDYIVLTR